MVAVEAVETFFCAEPEKAVVVLCAAIDRAVGKAILYLVMPEVIRLCVGLAKADY